MPAAASASPPDLRSLQGQLSLGQIARACSLDTSYISKIWSGQRTPGLRTVEKLAGVLGVDAGVVLKAIGVSQASGASGDLGVVGKAIRVPSKPGKVAKRAKNTHRKESL